MADESGDVPIETEQEAMEATDEQTTETNTEDASVAADEMTELAPNNSEALEASEIDGTAEQTTDSVDQAAEDTMESAIDSTADATTEGTTNITTVDSTEQETDGTPDDERKLFVGNLSWNTTRDQLHEYFSKFGEIKECTLKEENGRSRGFGFVTYLAAESREKVLAEKHTLDDRVIDPKKAEKQGPKQRDFKQQNKKIFVGGLDPELSEQEVRDYFETFGEIDICDLPKDRSTESRRAFAFITYTTEEAASKACEKPRITLGKRECDIKLAEPGQKQGFGGRGGFRGGYGGGGYNQAYGAGAGAYDGYGGYGQGQYGYGGYPYGQYAGGWGDYSQQYAGYGGYAAGGYDYYGGGYQQQPSSYGKSARGGRGSYTPYQR